MQRQRGELVPIADALADLDGLVSASRDDSPPARRGFTVADQVNQLINASEADPDLGFMARTMALLLVASEQPRQPASVQARQRSLHALHDRRWRQQAALRQPAAPVDAWLSTEAVRTQSRELVLGRSLSEFMRSLGINSDSGGARGEQTRLRNQMNRLFGCTVSLIYEDESGFARVTSPVADKHEFWWNKRKPGERVLWDSKIHLGEAFFNEIINHPVPLDTNTLTALKRSSLGLDLYLWLVYRTFTLRAPQRLTWRQVYRQFGAHPAKASNNNTVQAFRYKVLRELKKIKLAWRGLNYTTAKGVLILLPSTPSIPPAPEPLRLTE